MKDNKNKSKNTNTSTATTLNVKDLLKSGSSPEDLIKSLQKEIDNAQKEIKAENAVAAKEKNRASSKDLLDDSRDALIVAVIDYLTYLGLLPNEVSDEAIDELDELVNSLDKYLKSIEKNFNIFMPAWNMIKNMSIEDPAFQPDLIIKTFLKTL